MDVKAEILDTIQLPLQHPELFAVGLRRSGNAQFVFKARIPAGGARVMGVCGGAWE